MRLLSSSPYSVRGWSTGHRPFCSCFSLPKPDRFYLCLLQPSPVLSLLPFSSSSQCPLWLHFPVSAQSIKFSFWRFSKCSPSSESQTSLSLGSWSHSHRRHASQGVCLQWKNLFLSSAFPLHLLLCFSGSFLVCHVREPGLIPRWA